MLSSKTLYVCVIACLLRAAVGEWERESWLVDTIQGPVRGHKDPDSGVYFFQGIPYASIPTGPNRYKAPLPPPTWMHPLEAVGKNIACPQPVLVPIYANLKIQEDCLIASVYVPETKDKNLPVIVYVHGGGFQVGSGDFLIPSKLVANNNVIAVTFNYRLGAHGFLCLGTEDIPGNAGMKDQVTALRWVKKNIASFGGNPDDVTISGYSAGSASVDLLMLSKAAKGLFNKVIPESGASIVQWAIQSDPLEKAKQYANYMNFTNVDDIYALVDFYKTASFDLLTSVPFAGRTDETFGFSPCIERVIEGEEAFLLESPVDILKSGNYVKVPLLYGFANMEGISFTGFFDDFKIKMNEQFSDFLPPDLKFKSDYEKEIIAEQIKKFYFGDKTVGEDNILNFVDFFTDVLFGYSMLRAVKYHVEAGHDQVYLYDYSFVDDETPYILHTNVKGANHCAQTAAVFGGIPGYIDVNNATEEFLNMSSIMNRIWGNFIKTGKPVAEDSSLPAWPAVGANWSPQMSLGNEISLRETLEHDLERRTLFWEDIYSKYYLNPIPPPTQIPHHTEL